MLVIPEGLRALFASRPPPSDLSDMRGLMAARVRTMLELRSCPTFLPRGAGIAGKGQQIAAAQLTEQDEWQTPDGSWLLGFAQIEFADGETQNYGLPLALAWEDSDGDRMPGIALLHAGPGPPARARRYRLRRVLGPRLLSQHRQSDGQRSGLAGA